MNKKKKKKSMYPVEHPLFKRPVGRPRKDPNAPVKKYIPKPPLIINGVVIKRKRGRPPRIPIPKEELVR